MRARSQTELDTPSQQRLLALVTCLPNAAELALNRRRTSYVSWMKRYYFFSYQITMSPEIILLSVHLFVDTRIRIIAKRKDKENVEK